MRSEAPALLPLFRSRHQAELLTWLYLHPHDEYPATEIATRLGVPLSTLHREAQRLVAAGLIHDRKVGTPARVAVYEAADAAQDRLGLPVNPTVRSPQQWQDATDALVQQIKASPSVTVIDQKAGRPASS